MKKILVTGGAGYIGSHACKLLAQNGLQPVVFDNFINGHKWAIKYGPFEEGNIQDKEKLVYVINKYEICAVMHFAAFAYVGESVNNPLKYYKNNVAGSLKLIEAMRESGVNNIIFSSSCATYGKPIEIPISEMHPQIPINPYGASKLMVERMLADSDAAYGIKHVFLRYFNAAGADPDSEIGEDHDPETHLIPLILDVAAGRKDKIVIYGDDYNTLDGTCVRDYIHVCDLAEAHYLALMKLQQTNHSSSYNLGNGCGFSVKQVIEVAQKVTGKYIPYEIAERRLGDPAILVGDARKAIKELNWVPKYSALEDQISHAWNWYMKHY